MRLTHTRTLSMRWRRNTHSLRRRELRNHSSLFSSGRCFRSTHDDSWLTALNGNLRHLPCIPLYTPLTLLSFSALKCTMYILRILGWLLAVCCVCCCAVLNECFQFAVITLGFASNEPAFAETKWLKINAKPKLLFLSCAPKSPHCFQALCASCAAVRRTSFQYI